MRKDLIFKVKNHKGIQYFSTSEFEGKVLEIEGKKAVFLDEIENKFFYVIQPFFGNFEIIFGESENFKTLKKEIEKEKEKNNYAGFATASLFEKREEIITFSTQDFSKHITALPEENNPWWSVLQKYLDNQISDEIQKKNLLSKIKLEIPEILEKEKTTIRQTLKNFIIIPSGQGYDLNPGDHEDNHSEARTLYNFFGVQTEEDYNLALEEPSNQPKKEKLQDSTCYLYGHWWSCEDCGRKMEKVGVKKIVLSKDWVKEYLGLNS